MRWIDVNYEHRGKTATVSHPFNSDDPIVENEIYTGIISIPAKNAPALLRCGSKLHAFPTYYKVEFVEAVPDD